MTSLKLSGLKLLTLKKIIYVAVPSGTLPLTLNPTLSHLTGENKNIFLMGDSNINLLNCENNPESNDFLQMLNSYFFLSYILQPTRITEISATLIDDIFANSHSIDAISGNLVLKMSDHLPQFLIVDNIKVNYKILNYF